MYVNQVFRPSLDTHGILKDLKEIFDKGWIGLGSKTEELEQKIAKYLGVKYCICLNSCTAALHLAIKYLNIDQGSRVLTTPLTFVSTNHVLHYEKLIPVFYDIEKTTGAACVSCIREYKKAKAVIVMHHGGYSCDMNEINSCGLPVIEDCAHAFGAEYDGHKIGHTDNICCWSFHAVKNLPMGDGGAITTNDKKLYEWARKMRWLGIDLSTYRRSKNAYKWEYNVDEIGYKYHMNDITAVIGLNQLKWVDDDNAERREIAELYLAQLNCIKPRYEKNRKSSYHFLPLFFENREDIYKKLLKANIGVGLHYKPNYYYSMYKDCEKINDCKNVEWYYKRELTLPLHCELNLLTDVEKIKDIICE